MVTKSSDTRFGERTTNRRMKPRRKISKMEKVAEPDDDSESTTVSHDSLNHTLSNLNMTVDDLKERKEDMTVPQLSQMFNRNIESKSDSAEIIYGEKTSEDAGGAVEATEAAALPPPRRKDRPRPKYIQMDFGGGGFRQSGYDNPFSGGRNHWGLGGGLITNRRTTTSTRPPPITYFDRNGDRVEDKINIHSLTEESLLGDYEINYEYNYDDYAYPTVEVPEGIKSALIASSVVGGLAVILFLAMFMLCLWKQMKSKLRLTEDYNEKEVGMFSGMFGGKKKHKEHVEAGGGYFNKVSSTVEHSEPNYSTTSSEEY